LSFLAKGGKKPSVRLLHKLLAVVMLAIWLPASMHCALEDAGILEKDSACADSPTGTHDRSDECQFETSGIHLQKSEIAVAALIPALVVVIETAQLDSCGLVILANPSLPDLCPSWQFVYRTALPIRAPSHLA
jgi:hypothetical protein